MISIGFDQPNTIIKFKNDKYANNKTNNNKTNNQTNNYIKLPTATNVNRYVKEI